MDDIFDESTRNSNDADISKMKDYLGIRAPDDVVSCVQEVLADVEKQLERAADDFGSNVNVDVVEEYLKEQGYESYHFWSEISYCIHYSIDKNKVAALMVKYAPKK